MNEMGWRSDYFDVEAWVMQYIHRRYRNKIKRQTHKQPNKLITQTNKLDTEENLKTQERLGNYYFPLCINTHNNVVRSSK
jgi:hypothetical protein